MGSILPLQSGVTHLNDFSSRKRFLISSASPPIWTAFLHVGQATILTANPLP